MNDFLGLLGNWHLYVMFVAYWVVSNAIGALPLPTSTSSAFYGWLFRFANGFAANLSRATAGKIPGTDAMAQQEAQQALPLAQREVIKP